MKRLLFVMLLGACQEKVNCPSVTAQVDDWVRGLPRASHVSSRVPLLEREGGEEIKRADERAPMVEIDAHRVTLSGSPVWQEGDPVAGIPEKLSEASEERNAHERFDDDPSAQVDPTAEVLIAIAPDAPWRIVAPVLDAIPPSPQAPIDTIFVFGHPGGPWHAGRKPPRSSVDSELASIAHADPTSRAVAYARLMEKVIKKCPSMIHLFGELADVAPWQKEDVVRQGLAKGIADCNCRCDVDALRSIVYAIMVPTEGVSGVKVAIARNGAKEIALPGDMPWSAAAAKLVTNADEPVMVKVQ